MSTSCRQWHKMNIFQGGQKHFSGFLHHEMFFLVEIFNLVYTKQISVVVKSEKGGKSSCFILLPFYFEFSPSSFYFFSFILFLVGKQQFPCEKPGGILPLKCLP